MSTILYQPKIRPADSWRWGELLGRLGPLIGLVFVVLLFYLLTCPWEDLGPRGLWHVLSGSTFLTLSNIELMLRQTGVVGTAALGMTLIIILGGIDLSVGAAIALVTVTIASLLPGPTAQHWNLPPAVAACGGLLAGAACGLALGAMVIGHVGRVLAVVLGALVFLWIRSHFGGRPGILYTLGPLAAGLVLAGGLLVSEKVIRRVGLAPFIVSLGLWGALRGIATWYADRSMVYPDATALNRLLRPIHADHIWLLTPGVWMLFVLALLVAGMLCYTRFGRHIFAIGSNEQTARLCGVNVSRTKLMVYVLAGLFIGMAGLLQFSYLGMGDPTTAAGMELDIIAAVVIGGASLSGGQGSIAGTLIGALIMTAVANGCNKVGLDNQIQQIATGGIIIIAVTLDRLRQRA
jgi:ribose transport system permease protein